MKSQLVQAASKVIPDCGILVNMLSRRVRQLSLGHRPLVTHTPGMLAADIALTEIIHGKLYFEATPGEMGEAAIADKIVEFPLLLPRRKEQPGLSLNTRRFDRSSL